MFVSLILEHNIQFTFVAFPSIQASALECACGFLISVLDGKEEKYGLAQGH